MAKPTPIQQDKTVCESGIGTDNTTPANPNDESTPIRQFRCHSWTRDDELAGYNVPARVHCDLINSTRDIATGACKAIEILESLEMDLENGAKEDEIFLNSSDRADIRRLVIASLKLLSEKADDQATFMERCLDDGKLLKGGIA